MIDMIEEPEPILTIYKTEEFTAQILTTHQGIVLDLQIISFTMTSEFARRNAQRRRYYRQKLRVELPEEGRTNAMNEAGAWIP